MESKVRNRILLVLFIGVLIGALDIAIAGPALPAICAALGVDDRALSWIFMIYVLFNLVGTPLMAKLSDTFGRRNLRPRKLPKSRRRNNQDPKGLQPFGSLFHLISILLRRLNQPTKVSFVALLPRLLVARSDLAPAVYSYKRVIDFSPKSSYTKSGIEETDSP